MSVKVVALSESRKDVSDFVRFPEAIYKDQTHWVPPIIQEQIRYIRKGPFNDFGEKQLFMAYRDKTPVARLSVQQNWAHNTHYKVNQGFFGFFEAFEDIEAVKAIFEQGADWLRMRGCQDILGPMSFSIYEEIGLLIDGFNFDPTIMCPYNPPYYANLLEEVGFKKKIDWYGYQIHREHKISPVILRIHQRLSSRKNLVIRKLRTNKWDEEAKIIQHIFNESWAENWGHLPMQDSQWRYIANHVKLALIKELSCMALIDGKPIGFIIVVKDMNIAIKKAAGRLFPLGLCKLLWHSRKIKHIRIIIMGVLKDYRARGYDIALALESLSKAVEMGYETCDCSQVVEDNIRLSQGLEMMGARRYKTFRIFKKSI